MTADDFIRQICREEIAAAVTNEVMLGATMLSQTAQNLLVQLRTGSTGVILQPGHNYIPPESK